MLILVPFRSSAYKIISELKKICGTKINILNFNRFKEEFGEEEPNEKEKSNK